MKKQPKELKYMGQLHYLFDHMVHVTVVLVLASEQVEVEVELLLPPPPLLPLELQNDLSGP